MYTIYTGLYDIHIYYIYIYYVYGIYTDAYGFLIRIRMHDKE